MADRVAPSPALVRTIKRCVRERWVNKLSAVAQSQLSSHDVNALAMEIGWAVLNGDFVDQPGEGPAATDR